MSRITMSKVVLNIPLTRVTHSHEQKGSTSACLPIFKLSNTFSHIVCSLSQLTLWCGSKVLLILNGGLSPNIGHSIYCSFYLCLFNYLMTDLFYSLKVIEIPPQRIPFSSLNLMSFQTSKIPVSFDLYCSLVWSLLILITISRLPLLL